MSTFRQPFKGDFPITQRYGEIVPGVTYKGKPHTGIDYACPSGTRILASAAGTVMFAGWDETGFGNMVILQHKDGRATLYAHLSAIAIGTVAGVRVVQGEVIGYSGSTGNSTGPHLHFEARKVWNDPASHFDPMTLPLMSMDDNFANTSQNFADTSHLKEPDQLGDAVQIVCPLGAWGWSTDFGKRQTVFPEGTQLHYTGRTTKRNEYTYCEVYPEPVKYWVAVHDGTTQILDNSE